jgi:hypothetical protein
MTRAAAAPLLAGLALTACGGTAATQPSRPAPAPLPGGGAASPVCGRTGLLAGSTCTYRKVGSDTFTVPAGVTRAEFVVIGGAGGHYFIAGDAAHGGSPAGDITGRPGGAAGRVTATFTVIPGAVLQIDVAGAGANGTAARRSGGMRNGPSGGHGGAGGSGGSGDAPGGAGGTAIDGGNGSGGGGASDVRAAAGGCAGLRCPLSSRVVVAAGGGGGGGVGGQGGALGGAGGAAGAAGGSVVDGGNHGTPGHPAGAAAGGAAGLNPSRHAAGAKPGDPRDGGDGSAGSTGAGGTGGAGNRPCTDPSLGGQCAAGASTAGGGAGGGGGGGRFGGGGGSGGGGAFGGGGGAGGGGGGGGSYAAPTAVASTLGLAAQAGAEVTVSWAR